MQPPKLIGENRMNMHMHARLAPMGRAVLVARLKRGESPHDVARAKGIGARTGRKRAL